MLNSFITVDTSAYHGRVQVLRVLRVQCPVRGKVQMQEVQECGPESASEDRRQARHVYKVPKEQTKTQENQQEIAL